MTGRVYLDYNATTPLAAEVAAAMLPYLDEAFGNPSSLHWAGLPARWVGLTCPEEPTMS